MKILIPCQYFNYCSGSGMYVFDLANELTKRGHEVTILSEVGGQMKLAAEKAGVRTVDFSNIFSIQDEKFDVIHCNQYHPSELALGFFDVPAVMTLHSEFPIESPYVHKNIKAYVGVRPSICQKYSSLNPALIYNGIDFTRFNKSNAEAIAEKKKEVKQSRPIVLFVGTVDFLRKNVLLDLEERSKSEGFDLWVLGRNFTDYVPASHVKVIDETFFVEKWFEMADEVAGILFGRTAIEAWACGKSYRQYEVDEKGKILSSAKLVNENDMSEYDIKTMADKFIKIYEEIR